MTTATALCHSHLAPPWPPGITLFMLLTIKQRIIARWLTPNEHIGHSVARASRWILLRATLNGLIDFALVYAFAGFWWTLLAASLDWIYQVVNGHCLRYVFIRFQRRHSEMDFRPIQETVLLTRTYNWIYLIQDMYYAIVVLLLMKFLFLGSMVSQLFTSIK